MFSLTQFLAHSGQKLDWKIECDSLTYSDWECIAALIASHYTFGNVHGIPKGGNNLAQHLTPYCKASSDVQLIVDDVLTTGISMQQFQKTLVHFQKIPIHKVKGVVLFSRMSADRVPNWIQPMFYLEHKFHHAGKKA